MPSWSASETAASARSSTSTVGRPSSRTPCAGRDIDIAILAAVIRHEQEHLRGATSSRHAGRSVTSSWRWSVAASPSTRPWPIWPPCRRTTGFAKGRDGDEERGLFVTARRRTLFVQEMLLRRHAHRRIRHQRRLRRACNALERPLPAAGPRGGAASVPGRSRRPGAVPAGSRAADRRRSAASACRRDRPPGRRPTPRAR